MTDLSASRTLPHHSQEITYWKDGFWAWAGNKVISGFVKAGNHQFQRIVGGLHSSPTAAAASPNGSASRTSQLFEELGKLVGEYAEGDSDDLAPDNVSVVSDEQAATSSTKEQALKIIQELRTLSLTPKQEEALNHAEVALGVREGNSDLFFKTMQDIYEDNKRNQGGARGFLNQAAAALGISHNIGPYYDMLMGEPEQLLGKAEKALRALYEDLKKPGNHDPQLLQKAKEALNELLTSDETVQQALKGKTFKDTDRALLAFVQNGNPPTLAQVTAALKTLNPYIEAQRKEGLIPRAMDVAKRNFAQEIPRYVMGAPESELSEAQSALQTLLAAMQQPSADGNNALLVDAAKETIRALLVPEALNETFRGKQLSQDQMNALVAVRDTDALTPELVTAALEVLNKYCDMQRRDGLLPHAWGAAEEAAFRTLKEVAKGINPPLSEEDKLAQFVTEFCERGFADPAPPFVASATIDQLQADFILATANFSVKDLGPTARTLLLSWVHWYIGGFVKNIHNAFMGYFNAGIPEEQFALKEAVCTHATTFLQALRNHIAAKTPYDKAAAECEMNRLAGTIIDQFAPRFQLRVRVAQFFQRWPVIFVPFSWVFQGVAFILDGIANGFTLLLMKWVIAANRIVPMLLEEIKKSMGIGPGQEYPYNLQRTLRDRLNDGLTELQRGGIPAPYIPSERLKREIKDVVTELVPLLDAVAHAGGIQLTEVPEALLDQFASRDLIETLVVQIARLFHFALTPTNMDEWMSKLYTSLTECYNPSSPVDLATKKRMEKDFIFTKKKLIFLSIFFAIEEKMQPEIAARRQAARFLFSIKHKIQTDFDSLTEHWVGELSDRVLNPQSKKLVQPFMAVIAQHHANKEAMQKWALELQPIAALEVPPLDPDSAIAQIVRLAYKRYEPLTGSVLKLITDGTLMKALFDPPFIDPILGN